jgi:hypothetical protein
MMKSHVVFMARCGVYATAKRRGSDAEVMAACRQGLTLVHFSAQREHFLSHVVGCFAAFSDKNGFS